MLDQMEPEEFDERMAADLISGDPLSRIIEILKLGFGVMCRVKPSLFEPQRVEHELVFGPSEPGSSTSPQIASPNQAAMLATASLGPPSRRRS